MERGVLTNFRVFQRRDKQGKHKSNIHSVSRHFREEAEDVIVPKAEEEGAITSY